ncbi:MAG: hypothetical protein JXR70_08585 [Spirochaetales bacterium]|nr:hypothetical protein [Spirochaetales bacterium]
MLLVFLLLPGSDLLVFSGIPLISHTKYWVFLFLSAFVILKVSKGNLNYLFNSRIALVLVFMVLLVSWKWYSFILIEPEGFSAKYRALRTHPAHTPKAGEAFEFDADLFLSKEAITRFDSEINFENDWRFGFLNTRPHQIYQWVSGNQVRERTPFSAQWSGFFLVEVSRDSCLRIDYTGEGFCEIYNKRIIMEPSYNRINTIITPFQDIVPELSNNKALKSQRLFKNDSGIPLTGKLYVEFTFNDKSVIGNNFNFPNASLKIYETNNRFSKFFLKKNRTLSIFDKILLLSLDVSAGIMLIAFFFKLLSGNYFLPATFLLVFMGIIRSNFPFLFIPSAFMVLLLCNRIRRLNSQDLTIFSVLLFSLWYMPNLDLRAVFYRTPGSDPLTYEHFSRTMLEAKSLKDFFTGCEPIFYYQPFFRYYLSLMHIIFGNGDFGWLTFNHFVLIMAFPYFFHTISGKKSEIKALLLSFILFCFMEHYVVPNIFEGFTESLALIFTFFGLIATFSNRFSLNVFFSPLFLGLSAITRLNYLPVNLFILSLFAFKKFYRKKNGKKYFLVAISVFCLLYSLVPVHNLIYGKKIVLTTLSATIDVNLEFKPSDLPLIFTSEKVRENFLSRFPRLFHNGYYWGLNFVAFCWLLAVLSSTYLTALKRNSAQLFSLTYLLSPTILMTVHLFVCSMYLRHLLAYHMLMLIFTIFWIADKNHSLTESSAEPNS